MLRLKFSRRASAAPVMLMTGVALLSVAWLFGNPPFSAPDETQHFFRAIGVGQGHLIGPKVDYPAPQLPRVKRAWVRQAARGVHVPDGLSPVGSDCAAMHPEVSALCIAYAQVPPGGEVGVEVGNYEPLPYVVPGVALLRAHRPVPALYLARVASLLQTLPLLLVGIAALTLRRRHNGVAVAGAALALTPMVLFLCSSLNPSGTEIAAGFAFAACLIRLTDTPEPVWWVLAGVTATVLGASRSPGAVWVVALVAFFVLWRGPRRSLSRVRDSPRWAAMAGAGVLLGVALNRVWEGRYGSHVTTIVPTAAEGFKTAYKLWPRMARETIGSFGYLNVTMHAPPYWTWGVLIVALVAAGLVLATPYRRFVLALFVLGVLVLPAAQHFYVGMGSGYGVQARHLLPMFVVLPIVAAEAIRRGGDPSPTVARFLPLVLVPAAAVQLIAWWTNARRGAVGIFGPRMFFRSPAWSPPLGWYPWLFLAVAGSALIGAAGVLAASRVSDQSAEN